MKRKLIAFLIAVCCMAIAGCAQNALGKAPTEIPYAGAPKIVIDEASYYAGTLDILNELPDGYVEAGELTQEQMKYAYIVGSKYYVDPSKEALEDFYVYQECGTPTEAGGLDNTQRQWAYVHWMIQE